MPLIFGRWRAGAYRPVAKIQGEQLDRVSSGLALERPRARARLEPRDGVKSGEPHALDTRAMRLDTGRHEPVAPRLAGRGVGRRRVQERQSHTIRGAVSIGRSTDAHPVESDHGSRYTALSHGGLTRNLVARSSAVRPSSGTIRTPAPVVVRSCGS